MKGFSEALVTELRNLAPHVLVSVVMSGHIGTSILANRVLDQMVRDTPEEAYEASFAERLGELGVLRGIPSNRRGAGPEANARARRIRWCESVICNCRDVYEEGVCVLNLPHFLLRPVVALVNRWAWLARKVNRYAINKLVNSARTRPHPWSTAHDYISWTSLTDQQWSARHLPAVPRNDALPPTDSLVGLFARPPGVEQKLCRKSTLLFPAFAQYLTDGFIRTRMPHDGESNEVRRQNTSNHQIDLSPLYGRLPGQTRVLRLLSSNAGRRGRLKSQVIDGEEFALYLLGPDGQVKEEFVLLDLPLGLDSVADNGARAHLFAFGGDRANAVPQVAMINTLLLREHNRLAGELEKVQPGWDDERVFETARNVMIFLFIKIVVEEYINHLSSAPVYFSADPSVAWDAPWNKPNWMTTEFSLLYRWHSLIPDVIEWNGKALPVQATFLDNRPLIAGGLAESFVGISAQKAARLGAFNTTASLIGIEQAAIDQGRMISLAPYAAYRSYMGKPEPRAFSNISTDPDVVRFLESAYHSPGDVDFYVGLFAEDPDNNSPLPPLLLSMVALDAFSQALTSPLLSKNVLDNKVEAFSQYGWETIQRTRSLSDVLGRNCSGRVKGRVAMTQKGWKYDW